MENLKGTYLKNPFHPENYLGGTKTARLGKLPVDTKDFIIVNIILSLDKESTTVGYRPTDVDFSGVYVCYCDMDNSEDFFTEKKKCALATMVQKEMDNVSCQNQKLLYIFGSGTDSLTWREFLEQVYNMLFDPTQTFAIKLDNGQIIKCDEKVGTYLQKCGRQKRIHKITGIYIMDLISFPESQASSSKCSGAYGDFESVPNNLVIDLTSDNEKSEPEPEPQPEAKPEPEQQDKVTYDSPGPDFVNVMDYYKFFGRQ